MPIPLVGALSNCLPCWRASEVAEADDDDLGHDLAVAAGNTAWPATPDRLREPLHCLQRLEEGWGAMEDWPDTGRHLSDLRAQGDRCRRALAAATQVSATLAREVSDWLGRVGEASRHWASMTAVRERRVDRLEALARAAASHQCVPLIDQLMWARSAEAQARQAFGDGDWSAALAADSRARQHCEHGQMLATLSSEAHPEAEGGDELGPLRSLGASGGGRAPQTARQSSTSSSRSSSLSASELPDLQRRLDVQHAEDFIARLARVRHLSERLPAEGRLHERLELGLKLLSRWGPHRWRDAVSSEQGRALNALEQLAVQADAMVAALVQGGGRPDVMRQALAEADAELQPLLRYRLPRVLHGCDRAAAAVAKGLFPLANLLMQTNQCLVDATERMLALHQAGDWPELLRQLERRHDLSDQAALCLTRDPTDLQLKLIERFHLLMEHRFDLAKSERDAANALYEMEEALYQAEHPMPPGAGQTSGV